MSIIDAIVEYMRTDESDYMDGRTYQVYMDACFEEGILAMGEGTQVLEVA